MNWYAAFDGNGAALGHARHTPTLCKEAERVWGSAPGFPFFFFLAAAAPGGLWSVVDTKRAAALTHGVHAGHRRRRLCRAGVAAGLRAGPGAARLRVGARAVGGAAAEGSCAAAPQPTARAGVAAGGRSPW